MSRLNKLSKGDLVVSRRGKVPYIVLDVRKYHRKAYGAAHETKARMKFLLLSPQGRQVWKIDTQLKVEYYLPGEPYFDDVR